MTTKYKLVLASNSPRRKELLKGLDIDFEVRLIEGIDESYPADVQIKDVPMYIAQKKAQAYLNTIQPDDLIITADTVVILDNEILEKPANKEEGIRMLKKISGKTHKVVTAVVMTTKDKQKSFSVESKVDFSELTDQEIIYYVNKYKPFDKAGAYGIQEWIGYIGVRAIEGSFYNVMGLPVQRLYKELNDF
jgi:septum formation protein